MSTILFRGGVKLSRWFDLEVVHCSEAAEEANRILEERTREIPDNGAAHQRCHLQVTFIDRQMTGYALRLTSDTEDREKVSVEIGAGQRRNFIAGVGELLKRLLAATSRSSLACGSWEFTPEYQSRVHYMPAHFGNSFEVAWSGEMRRYLEDLALAGASGYGDWFDPNDMPDPYHPHVYHSTSMFIWRRKKEWLSYSQQLGLDNVLVVTPNIGFVDQMRPEWVGVRDHRLRVQGQVLCPSNEAARAVILQNHRHLFADLQASGVRITKVVCAPYDDGGCGCSACQPYYPVFLDLIHDVYNVAKAHYPELKIDICGWWTSEEEMKQLQYFAAGPAREWFGSYQFSATYGVFALPDVRSQIDDLSLGCFLHIGFSNDNRDVYTKTGVHSASQRLQSVIRSFRAQQCQGFMTYNESFGDHYNAFVASQLGWNPDASVREITEFYCRLILGLTGEYADILAGLLLEMQHLDNSKAAQWKQALSEIRPHIRIHSWQPWAFEHIAMKAELMSLDYQIELQSGTDMLNVLPQIRQRLDLSERLWRQVYGLGVLRHILIPERMLPEWYQTYRQYVSDSNGNIDSGTMSLDA